MSLYHSTFCLTARCKNCGDPACRCNCHTVKRIQHFLDEIEANGRGLSEWETKFVESVSEQFEETGSLSLKQQSILERIYAQKTP